MIVAGLGLRATASLAALEQALDGACGNLRPDAIATLADRAALPAVQALAAARGVPLRALAARDLAGVATPTQSPRILAAFATGSIAEAAALVAAGPGACLIAPRCLSADGTATAALAHIPRKTP